MMIVPPENKSFTIHIQCRVFIKENGDNLIVEGKPLKYTFDMVAATDAEALSYVESFLKERIPNKT